MTRSTFDGDIDERRSTGVVDYAGDRSELVDQETGGRTIKIGDVTYTGYPVGGGLLQGKRWLRVDASESEPLIEQGQEEQPADDGLGVSAEIIRFSSVEPRPDEYLDYLRAVSGELERVGAEDVREVPTTHYRTKVDLRRAVRHDLVLQGWKEVNIEHYVDALGDGDVTEFDVWVDADQLARRVVTKYISPLRDETNGDQTITLVVATEFLDFGVAVDIDAPAEDEVIDWSDWVAEIRTDGDESELVEPLP